MPKIEAWRRTGIKRRLPGTISILALAMLAAHVSPARAADLNVTSGTFEVTDPSDVSQSRVVVDDTADEDATLKIDSGVIFSKDIWLNNDGALLNEGTILRTGSGVNGVFGSVGLGHVTNQAGGEISVDEIGVWLNQGGSVLNTGDGSSISGRIAIDTHGTSTITNELGASIHGGTGSGLYVDDSTIINRSGATITSDGAEAVRMAGSGSVTNTGDGSEISGDTFGVTIFGTGDVYNLDGASISGGAAVNIDGEGTVENEGSITSNDSSSAGVGIGGGGTLTNRAGGTVSGYMGVYAGDAISIDNAGSITGTGYTGIAAEVSGSSLTNHDGGTISGVGAGVAVGGNITNTGAGSKISATDTAARLEGGGTLRNEDGAVIDGDYLGADMYDGGDVYNTGGSKITSTNGDGIDLWIYGSVTNSGEGSSISGGGNYGIYFDPYGEDNVLSLTNSDKATVSGGYAGAVFIDTNGTVLNEGGAEISSDVYGLQFDGGYGTITNQTGASIISHAGSAITMDAGGEIHNMSGGAITGVVTGLYLLSSEDYTIDNTGTGSAITATGSGSVTEADAIYVTGPATITNSDGASISGTRFGAWITGGGSFANEGEDTLINGDGTAIRAEAEATVENMSGARITGGNAGVDLENGGSVTNSTGASISATDEIIGAGVVLVNGGTLTNESGATIFGGYGAVALFGGGSVTNGAGSTLSGGTYGIYAEGGGTTVSNAGSVVGDVELSTVDDNHVTLYSGSSIDGNLYIDNRATSTLTFDGVGTQLLSDAVTGSFAFGGVLTKQGAGTWIIDKNLLADQTNVTAGALIVGVAGQGNLISDVNVSAGATLGGSGKIYGDVVVNGTVTPGNSPGVLTVVGNYTQTAGSTFVAQIDTDSGLYDRISVSGAATIDPGAILNVQRIGSAPYVVGTQYVFLSATGGVTGSYVATGDLAISPFLTLSDHYSPDLGYLQVEQTMSLTAGAQGASTNQLAVVNAIQSGPAGPTFAALTNLPSVAALTAALPQLTGELYPSMAGAMLEDSRYVRNAAIDRLENAPCADPLSDQDDAGAGCGLNPTRFWSSAIGAWAHNNAAADVASMNRTTGGLLYGVDTALDDFWRAGLLTGYGVSHFEMNDLASSATSDDYHFGLYAGTLPGRMSIKLGALRTWHSISASRTVNFTGVQDHLSTDYHAETTQVFGEAGYRIAATGDKVEPFVNVTYAENRMGDFSESGGAAALTRLAGNNSVVLSTVGAHLSDTLRFGETKAAIKGLLGFRNASGDTSPGSDFEIGGSGAYRVHGLPVPRNALVTRADIELALRQAVTFGLSGDGQFTQNTAAFGLQARLSISF